jgi:hypothetical protein
MDNAKTAIKKELCRNARYDKFAAKLAQTKVVTLL